MKRKITTILLAMILVIGTAIGLCACADQEDIDNALLPVEQQVTLINTTLDEMKATDKTLGDSITALTGRVSTLEGELETAQNNIGSISTALEKEIADRKADIKTLQDQDADLQAQITALETALTNKEQGIKDWANGVFVTISDWTAFKNELNTTIESLTSRIETLESSVGKINSTLTEMKATDTSLKNSIDGLTTRVTALEAELVEVNTKITSLQTDSATKAELETVKTALQNQIDDLNDEIDELKIKDDELQMQIDNLQDFLTVEIGNVKDWASNIFLSIENWNKAKVEIDDKISALRDRVNVIEDTLETMNTVISALQQQVEQNKQDIADLTIRVNCLEGKHVVDTTTITYTWADDFSTCTASITCVHCGTVNETAKSTISDRTCTVSFANEAFSTQTYDLTDLTNMTADQQAKALNSIFATKPTTLTLDLPKDFSSFSLINDLIKSYDKDKYIDLTLKGVETIPEKAFFQNNKLKSITFGDSVKTIGEYAFSNCTSLTSVTFEEGIKLETIGEYAFNYSAITEITIPKSVTSINKGAFYVCIALKSITFENGTKLETIGNHALHATAITSITVPKSVTEIGDWAFAENTSLKTVIFEADSKLETVGDYVFHTCSALTGITIPEGTTSIGEAIFQNCSRLASVTLPSSLTTIGNAAFWSCTSLESIIIPEKTTSIPELLFYGCTALKSITFKGVIESFDISAFAGVTEEDCTLTLAAGQKKLVCVGVTDMVYVPSEDLFFGGNVFCGMTFKEIAFTVAIDATNMSASDLQNTFGNYVSKGATNFEITLAANADSDVFKAIQNGFASASEKSVTLVLKGDITSIPAEAFEESKWIKSISIPDSVTSIGVRAFYGSTLETITFGENSALTSISQEAFKYCENLSGIVIPKGVTFIDIYAFEGCTSLVNIVLPDKLESIEYGLFDGCDKLESVTLGKNVTSIGLRAFWGTSIKEIIIPKSVTSIGYAVFGNCNSLETIRYEGTAEEWDAIIKTDEAGSWNEYINKTAKVVFSNATVTL